MNGARLAAELLSRVLALMGALAPRLQAALGSPDADLDALRGDVDELGWALSLLSAVGEGQPELARHHRRGLAILLALLYPSAETDRVPDLEPQAGVTFAWAQIERLAGFAGAFPEFECRTDGWRIRSTRASAGEGEQPVWTLYVPPDWLRAKLCAASPAAPATPST